jgi:hypothetical protein
MPIDNNTVIGTEEWPLLGYNIFMRQSELGLPPAVEVLRLAALSFVIQDPCRHSRFLPSLVAPSNPQLSRRHYCTRASATTTTT